MATIVFFCIPAWGHTNPTLGVVRELAARGHEVLYYSYEPLREAIEAAGARFVPCDDFDAQLHLTPEEGRRVGKDLALSTRVLVDTTLALDGPVCREMEELRPACIVGDSMAVWAKAAAWKLGLPYVCSTTTFAFNRYSAKVMKNSPGQMLSMLLSLPAIRRDIGRLQGAGYPVNGVLDLLQSDEHTHTLIYTSPQFQPCADTFPAEYYSFVGPSLRPVETPFEKRRDRLVYISLGTVNNLMPRFYRDCIAALGDTEYQAVLSVGADTDIPGLGPLPANVEVYPSVDQMALLEKADVFLTHCGMNSANEALAYGVPLICLPQTSEQGSVAERAAELGAGLLLKKPTAQSIRQAVERVLREEGFCRSAQELARGFARCPGPAGAADKLLAVAGVG